MGWRPCRGTRHRATPAKILAGHRFRVLHPSPLTARHIIRGGTPVNTGELFERRTFARRSRVAGKMIVQVHPGQLLLRVHMYPRGEHSGVLEARYEEVNLAGP